LWFCALCWVSLFFHVVQVYDANGRLLGNTGTVDFTRQPQWQPTAIAPPAPSAPPPAPVYATPPGAGVTTTKVIHPDGTVKITKTIIGADGSQVVEETEIPPQGHLNF
jgi:hypothetical protein